MRTVRHRSDALIVGILVAFMLVLALAGRARADVPQFSTGPSVTFFRLGWQPNDATNLSLGNKAAVDVLNAGVGWAARWNPPALVSKDGQIAYMSLDGTLFANLGALPTHGGMALAVGPSFYNGLFGIQAGCSLFQLYDQPNRPMEGLFNGGEGGIRNFFILVTASVNLLFQGGNPKVHALKVGASSPPPPNYWRVTR